MGEGLSFSLREKRPGDELVIKIFSKFDTHSEGERRRIRWKRNSEGT
jgi:hypothetical protein